METKRLIDLIIFGVILLIVFWVASMLVQGTILLAIGVILILLFISRLLP